MCRKLFLSVDVIKELVFHKNDFSSRLLNARDHSVPDSLLRRSVFGAKRFTAAKKTQTSIKIKSVPMSLTDRNSLLCYLSHLLALECKSYKENEATPQKRAALMNLLAGDCIQTRLSE